MATQKGIASSPSSEKEARLVCAGLFLWINVPSTLTAFLRTTVTLNLRYELPDQDLRRRLGVKVEQVTGLPFEIVVDRPGTAPPSEKSSAPEKQQ